MTISITTIIELEEALEEYLDQQEEHNDDPTYVERVSKAAIQDFFRYLQYR